MAEVFGVAAGVVGIIAPALHWTRLLLADLHNISDAPDAVKRLEGDFNLIDGTLKSLEAITQAQWEVLGASVIEQCKETTSACTKSCQKFRTDLQGWTRHSSDGGKLSWQDRANVGFFQQGRIKSMSDQLHHYRAALNLVVSTATFHSSLQHSRVTEDIKTAISEKTTEISTSITTSDKQLTIVNTGLGSLDIRGNTSTVVDDGTYGEGTDRGILEEEQVALQLSLKLLEALKSKNEEEKERINQKERNQSMTVTFGSNNYGFQAGSVNGNFSGMTFGGRGG
ncbi:hypothetical protein F4859DRAFT_456056 [Xylaria cf. heliscus]|nr:hypothetical protein F4859DRAFT_456056 [Xylaria cf. heliscus]